ncbi:unnamed protein product [Scytosiphon promiscuus]
MRTESSDALLDVCLRRLFPIQSHKLFSSPDGRPLLGQLRNLAACVPKQRDGQARAWIAPYSVQGEHRQSIDESACSRATSIDTTKGHIMNPTTVQQQPQQQQSSGAQPPPGAPAGGNWVEESYCGGLSCIIGLLGLWCIICCPVDKRTVYVAAGKKYNMMGAATH